MNQITIDGCVQKDAKLYEEIANFNISAITGEYTCVDGSKKNRFTYIRVVYPKPITEYLESVLEPGVMIRIYGKLDSEQYKTASDKIVYNKILVANKIVKIKYDKDLKDYVEVV
jgi:hypothetical protein